MKIIERAELEQILKDHKKWLETRFTNNVDGRCANLCDADLCDADLCGADLRCADLRGADLRGADLCDADLCDANLRGADLRDANLCGTDLRDADLRSVVSIGSKQANFIDCDLDFCSIPLSCRGLNWKIDKRLCV